VKFKSTELILRGSKQQLYFGWIFQMSFNKLDELYFIVNNFGIYVFLNK